MGIPHPHRISAVTVRVRVSPLPPSATPMQRCGRGGHAAVVLASSFASNCHATHATPYQHVDVASGRLIQVPVQTAVAYLLLVAT